MSTDNIKTLIAALTGEEENLWRRVSENTRPDGCNVRDFALRDNSRSMTIKGDDASDFEVLSDTFSEALPEPQRLFTPDEIDGAWRVLELWQANNHEEKTITKWPFYRHALPGIFSISIGLDMYQHQWDEDTNSDDDVQVRHVPLSMTMSELKHTLSMNIVVNGRMAEECEESFLLSVLPDWMERSGEGTLSVSNSKDMTIRELINELSNVGFSIVQNVFEGTERLDFTVGQFIAKIPGRIIPSRRWSGPSGP